MCPIRISEPSETMFTADFPLPPYPLLNTAGLYPLSFSNFASIITVGVFPVPPTVIFPMLTTLQESLFCFRIPLSYILFRKFTTGRYSKERRDRIRVSGFRLDIAVSAYQIFLNLLAKFFNAVPIFIFKLQIVEFVVFAPLFHKGFVGSLFDDFATYKHYYTMGVADR